VISTVPQPPAPPAKRGLRAAMMGLGVLVVAAIGAVYWVSQHRDYLCDRYHLFCDPEVLAYREASDCAAPKACGVSACLAHYRDTYPNGRFSADIESIAIKKGRDCPVENPPPAVDPEKVAYDRVQACATSRTCGASVCVADYRQSFPNGAHKADVDRIVAEKGADCIDPAAAAAAATEKEVYDQADACARSKSCGALDCVADYRRDYPNGRYKAQIDQIAQAPSAALCPDLDREAYDRAEHCAEPLRCGADHCLIEYRRDFPNGKYRPLIDQIGAMKGPACTPPPTPPLPVTPPSPDLPPVNRRTNEDAGLNCGKADLEPIEQMVCADADMARANADLQKLYFQKRRQLSSADARKDLYDQEMNWIDQRNADCGVPRSGTWSEMELRKLKTCFIDHTRARVNELR
jgi:uncharacterized protein YecT (DUF1311 family)